MKCATWIWGYLRSRLGSFFDRLVLLLIKSSSTLHQVENAWKRLLAPRVGTSYSVFSTAVGSLGFTVLRAYQDLGAWWRERTPRTYNQGQRRGVFIQFDC
jgi:hypothetical protein